MKRYSLGLDVGISSVGWSVVDLENGEIVDLGVRLFEERTAAENLKRRTMRGGRRLKRRRAQRILDAKKLLKEHGIIVDEFQPLENPYAIRCKGLGNSLSNDEFSTAYLHIVKRRGSSHENVQESDSNTDEESTKAALQSNDRLIREGKYPCEIQSVRLLESGKIREHKNNFRTSHYVLELEKILSNQTFSVELQQELIDLVKRRRMYYDGPGSLKSPTPYGRFLVGDNGEIIVVDLIEKMRGKCSVYPEELRAPKMAPSSELFNFLNDLNNLSYGQGEKLTVEQKRNILENNIYQNKHHITPTEVAKIAGLSLEDMTGFRVDKNGKRLLTDFKGLKSISSAVEHSEVLDDFALMDEIADILTKVKGVEERYDTLLKLNHPFVEALTCRNLCQLKSFTQYHSISLKAINEMMEDLILTSDNQMQILARKHLLHNHLEDLKGLIKIPVDDDSILSPVARRSRQETMKIVNAARKRFGEFESIVVEMPRDKNSDEEVKRINDEQKEFEKFNQHCKEVAGGKDINGSIRKKIRLYEQQDGKCAYTGKPLDLNLILNDSTAYEIDHIIPISISFDDSMQNKVLVLHRANHEKGNVTPIMAFNQHRFTDGWDKQTFISFVMTQMKTKKFGYKKAYYLLYDKDITKFDVLKEFINRNLVDTRYASKNVLNSLQDYFRANMLPTKVITVKGAMTAAFRSKISLPKDRELNHYHHAVDATIIALLAKQDYLNKVIQNISVTDGILEVNDALSSEIIDEDSFFNESLMRTLSKLRNIEAVKISYKVDRKPNRQISDETIYSTREVEGETKVVKKYKDIYNPKDTKLAIRFVEGKVQDLLMYHNDPKTFEKLKVIVDDYLISVGPIAKENPFDWYRKNHGKITKYARKNDGPVIDSVKYFDGKLGNHIDVTKHYPLNLNPDKQKKVVLLQISPYRTDFYQNSDGVYKFVTLRFNHLKYYAKDGMYKVDLDWYEQEKNKKGIVAIDKFQFSLNRNDYLEIVSKDEKTKILDKNLWRFIATNNDNSSVIELKPIYFHDTSRIMKTIGKKTVHLGKFSTDILGDLYEIKNEALKLEFK